MFNELHEECGVFGVYSRDGLDVASLCYYGDVYKRQPPHRAGQG